MQGVRSQVSGSQHLAALVRSLIVAVAGLLGTLGYGLLAGISPTSWPLRDTVLILATVVVLTAVVFAVNTLAATAGRPTSSST